MKKIVAILGGVLVLGSIMLPWYSMSTPFGDLSITLMDMYDLSQGFDLLGYSIGENENFQYFMYIVIGAGLVGIVGGLINKYALSILGALGSIGSAALFASAIMDSELGSEALWGSVSYLGATMSWGVSLGFGLVIIGGILLLASK